MVAALEDELELAPSPLEEAPVPAGASALVTTDPPPTPPVELLLTVLLAAAAELDELNAARQAVFDPSTTLNTPVLPTCSVVA